MSITNGYQAKKNFGQNFLQNEHTITKVLELIKASQPSSIVEIGPGLGAFTKYFNESGLSVKAIEIDHDLVPILKKQFTNVKIINEDFLNLDLGQLELKPNTVFFGALPYNISKQIIRKLIESKGFQKGFFIIQKEVAEKYTATSIGNGKSTNKLGLFSQIYADFNKHFDISPGQFLPRPKVTSSLIEVNANNNREQFTQDQIKELEKLINTAFSHPRKTLANNLKANYPKLETNEFSKLRPENLSLQQYITLLNEL